jgi:manganese/zinc/iron transport system ATP- binding protein
MTGDHTRNAISIDALDVAYGPRTVLQGATVGIRAGAMTAVVGPNGAGKSTLLRAVMGMLPFAGSVRVLGGPIDACRKRVAYVPQRAAVDWDFPITVRQVAEMGAHARLGWFGFTGRRARREALEALADVGLADLAARPIGELSGGQQQRAFVARALAQRADLVLLDEPFASIDATTERDLLDLLAKLRDRGTTVVVVHHDLSTVRERFDDAVLVRGTVIAHGAARKVMTAELLARTYGDAPGHGTASA